MCEIKILIVDYREEIRNLIKFILPKDRFKILEADNCDDAIDIFKGVKPNVVIIDELLPKSSGSNLCFDVKSFSDIKTTLIVVGSNNLNSSFEQCGGIKADYYMTKPFSPSSFINILATLPILAIED